MSDEGLRSLLSAQPCFNSDCTTTYSDIRGEAWIIIKNPLTGAHVRIFRDLWLHLCRLDGNVTLQRWIEPLAQRYGEQRLLSMVVQLKRQGMLIFPGSAQLSEKSDKSVGAALFSRYNPLMLRVALFNPTKLLDSFCKLPLILPLKWLLVAVGLLVAMALLSLILSGGKLVTFWQAYSQNMQIWHFVLLFPLTKCLHELAHGWVLRYFGGDAPEAGISFIVLFPMPYVDATDAWSLPRRNRMLVTGAGMAVDFLLACVGIVLWAHLAPGAIASMGFTLALMGVVSIFVFNANPLLKFDGYYLLEDALDSPGLARRSHSYMRYIVKRYVFLLNHSVPPPVAPGERAWLVVYAVSSCVYRFVLAAIISVYLISTLHELGIVLSLFSLIPLCVLPLLRFARFLSFSKELNNSRLRAVSVLSVIALCCTGFIFSVPVPSSTRTQGIVWVDEQAQVYASQSGTIDQLMVASGDVVKKGEPIMALGSDGLDIDLERQRAAVRLAQLVVEQYRQSDPARAQAERIVLDQAEYEVQNAIRQLQQLTMVASVSGRVVLAGDHLAPGALVSQGDLLAYVVNDKDRVVRAVVPQKAMGQVDTGVIRAHVRLAQNLQERIPARITRQTPAGSHQLPSSALANTGFGGFDMALSTAQTSTRTAHKVFHVELELFELVGQLSSIAMGTKAFVTLEHSAEPLGRRWLRISRQLLLKHLSV